MRPWQRRPHRTLGSADKRNVQEVTRSASTEPQKWTLGDGLRRRPLFGMGMVDAERLETVVDAVLGDRPDADSDAGSLPILVTPNVDIVVVLDRSPDSIEADVFRRARFVLPDGMPLVKVSGLLGQPLSSRLTGSDLFELLWPRLCAERRPTVVVCAESEIGRRLAESHPLASFVVPPFFDASSSAALSDVVDQVMERLDVDRTEFVLFGLGHPKDAILAYEVCRRWPSNGHPTPLCLGLGGSFAMYTGLRKRAPAVVQRIGAEWLFRFFQEPRRLFSRYFIRDVAFIGIVWRELRSVRRQKGNSSDES